MPYRKRVFILSIGSLLASASSASPMNLHTLPTTYVSVANKYKIPADIFYAVAMVESKTSIGNGLIRPWPWTLNNAGTPYRFSTAKQTIDAIKQLQNSGTRNIDVGVMQINLIYHGHRFSSLSEAVYPESNLAAAAQILSHEYTRCNKDWWCAVGNYHSYRTSHANNYRQKVRYEWEAIQ